MLTRIFLFSILWIGDHLQRGFSQIWLKDKDAFFFFFLQLTYVASICKNIKRDLAFKW
jgi:hypothetical protein